MSASHSPNSLGLLTYCVDAWSDAAAESFEVDVRAAEAHGAALVAAALLDPDATGWVCTVSARLDDGDLGDRIATYDIGRVAGPGAHAATARVVR